MLVTQMKNAVKWFNRSRDSHYVERRRELRKLVVESLEDRRVMAAIPLTGAGITYNQDFDSLSNSGTDIINVSGGNFTGALDGWGFAETGSSGNTSYRVGTGSLNTGDTYSFGASGGTDRALGSLQSGSTNPRFGASFVNNSGGNFASVDVSYVGEQWRLGATGRNDRLDFQYSVNATSLTDSLATWVDFNSLDFTGPISGGSVGALDGNLPANRATFSNVNIPALNLAPGATIWFRWNSFDVSGADDGLAVDNFSITPVAAAVPGVSITPSGDTTGVHEDAFAIGATDTYSISLQSAPTSDVTINIHGGSELNVSPNSIVFNQFNWNVPQEITISAVDDTDIEGLHSADITHTAVSASASYNGISIPDLTVTISDNEVPVGMAISLTGGPYNQNFDTLLNTGASAAIVGGMLTGDLEGWGFAESGTNANFSYAADRGSSNSGNTYSYGATDDSERAFGSLSSSSLDSIIGGLFVNDTGSEILELMVSYVGEQWRLGELREADSLNFQYSLDAYSLTSGNWLDVDSLDFVAPQSTGTVGALDGNDAANRSLISATIPSLSIPAGSAFWIRWTGVNVSGADDGLAIDDFSISTAATQTPGVVVTEFDGGTEVEEGGLADTYTIVLQSQPTANVEVTINTGSQVNASEFSVVFTPSDWDVPRTITLNAIDDAAYEGTHFATVTHTVVSADPQYNGIAVSEVAVTIRDNEAPIALAIPLSSTPYSQDFNSLLNSGSSSQIQDGLLDGGLQGWAFVESGTGGNLSYSANNGSNTAGNTYSYGATDDSDRALGGLNSNAVESTIGSLFVNSTSTTIDQLDVAYFGELWRLGEIGRTDWLDFQYSLDATSLSNGTWIDADQLDFFAPIDEIGPAGARDGNAPENRINVVGSISGLGLAPGAILWVRWIGVNVAGNDDGLAIDDFTISTPAATNTSPTITSISDQTLEFNTSTGVLGFTVGDAESPATELVVTVASSNAGLIPEGNIVVSGSGSERTVTVTPLNGQFGSSTITLTVSDGELTSSTSFEVTVNEPLVIPQVESVVFGDGTSQRSMVKTITVRFNTLVEIDSNAFELRRRVGTTLTSIPSSELSIAITTSVVSGKTVATLTFTGSSVIGGSLSDGNYHLTVVSSAVRSAGVNLDGDSNGAAGGDYTRGAIAADNFFRLFGDFNGNGSVNVFDVNAFRSAFGTSNQVFDFNSLSGVNVFDLNAFRSRVGQSRSV